MGKKDYRLGTALKKDRNRERQGKLSRAGSWVSYCDQCNTLLCKGGGGVLVRMETIKRVVVFSFTAVSWTTGMIGEG